MLSFEKMLFQRGLWEGAQVGSNCCDLFVAHAIGYGRHDGSACNVSCGSDLIMWGALFYAAHQENGHLFGVFAFLETFEHST